MTVQTADAADAIGLAERILTVLDQGRFTATYKYAVLLGLMDLCLEGTSHTGIPPRMVTTRQLAEKLIELYWPHTIPYAPASDIQVLRQNTGKGNTQATIVAAIEVFRNRSRSGNWTPLTRAKLEHRKEFNHLLDSVEWTLIQMPLPKLQRASGQEHRFLYEIAWSDDIKHSQVRQYQRDRSGNFDNRIQFLAGVSESLVRLNGLLRPLIHKQWTLKVAQINGLPEARLESFLFGSTRAVTEPVRGPLQELQQERCFYCEERLSSIQDKRPEVDHFIPWARYPDDGLANLVVAHEKCNRHKRDFLAGNAHVKKWLLRNLVARPELDQLQAISEQADWEIRRDEILGVASAVYLSLPEGVELWCEGKRFEVVNPAQLGRIFNLTGHSTPRSL